MLRPIAVLVIAFSLLAAGGAAAQTVRYYAVPPGSDPHDGAPAPDGSVWYTAQRTSELGRLDPASGKTEHIPLGRGSAPHGVIVGPDGAAWVTDSGLNAIVRVDPKTRAVKAFALPAGTPYVNMNTAAFDGTGVLWWTGQSGYYGSVNPASGETRVWPDSKGRLWLSEWLSGQVSMYDPASGLWRQWKPSDRSRMYAVFVDDRDIVWLTEWESNAIVRFDPAAGKFQSFPSDRSGPQVRQILGRPGEMWGAESGTDRLVVVITRSAAAAPRQWHLAEPAECRHPSRSPMLRPASAAHDLPGQAPAIDPVSRRPIRCAV